MHRIFSKLHVASLACITFLLCGLALFLSTSKAQAVQTIPSQEETPNSFSPYGDNTIKSVEIIEEQTQTVCTSYTHKLTPLVAVPKLEVKDVRIAAGTPFAFSEIIVEASDAQGNNLADKVIVVDDGGFDATKPGIYAVTFMLTDKAGASVTKTASITVTEKPEYPDPDSNPRPNPDPNPSQTPTPDPTPGGNPAPVSQQNQHSKSQKKQALPKTIDASASLGALNLLEMVGIGLTVAGMHHKRN